MIKIYHNPRCRKSRETLELIQNKRMDIEIIEYLKDPPTEKELSQILDLLGIKPIELVRKGEDIYKENYKGKTYGDNEWIKILVEHPKLIERPIVISNGKAAIGRPPEKVLGIL
ncbi:MAG: arsenate reductase (glutaredoxin) [Bacteroidota bacterium]